MAYSTQKIATSLLSEIKSALQRVAYGSIEIFVQNSIVTQITVRNIKKTSYNLYTDTTNAVKLGSATYAPHAKGGKVKKSKNKVLTSKK